MDLPLARHFPADVLDDVLLDDAKSHMNHDEVIAPYATATAATKAQLQPK